MSNVQEALKAAIEAFELHAKQYPHMVKGYCIDALEDCKAALSEIEKCEPVAWINPADGALHHYKLYDTYIPLYGKPQPRDWVGLSYDEIESLYDGGSWHEFANAISEKLKHLNTKG